MCVSVELSVFFGTDQYSAQSEVRRPAVSHHTDNLIHLLLFSDY